MRHAMKRFATGLQAVAGSSVLAAASAVACGACVEDKMAATYDHAQVEQAAAQGKVVVFCDLRGPVPGRDALRAAAPVDGVATGSLRLSAEPAALSFVLDPAAKTPQAAADALARSLGGGVQLSVLRTLPGAP